MFESSEEELLAVATSIPRSSRKQSEKFGKACPRVKERVAKIAEGVSSSSGKN